MTIESDVQDLITTIDTLVAAVNAALTDLNTGITSADAAATSAASSFDAFNIRYLGAFPAAPTLDNDGDAIANGAMYFDLGTNEMNVFGSGVWNSFGSNASIKSSAASAASETAAAVSAATAVAAATSASTAEVSIQNIFDTFDDRFLGAFAVDPVLDNDGDPLILGAMYFSTESSAVRFYNGTTWEAPATVAAGSAAAAAASATAAAASEAVAAASEIAAAASQVASVTNQLAAATSAGQAALSEINAGVSETAASISASASANSAANAAASETAASASEIAAESHETNTLVWAREARNSADASSDSATASASSAAEIAATEIAAVTSAAASATSAAAAAASKAATAALLDTFSDSYLGSLAGDPILDNDGNTLIEGALYFNSTRKLMKVYNGVSWDVFDAAAAADSATAAAASEAAAAASEIAAAASEAASTASALTSAISATAADDSKTASASSAAAASTSASESARSAIASDNSAINAAVSESAATDSETNAAISATNAGNSATAAAASASSADVSETAAAASAAAAAVVQTAVAGSATSTTAAATAALSSSVSAANSASNAQSSETTATNQAANASTYATNALTSQTASAASAAAALISETQAATSVTTATAAEAAITAIFDNFGAQFLGAKTTDPVVDNENNPLVAGAVYFNATAGEVRFYNGTSWDAPSASATASATAALASETEAREQALHAVASARVAATNSNEATNSASASANSAANAAASQTAASASEIAAGTSESNAAISASSATTSATNAGLSETRVMNSATAAAASETAATASEIASASSAAAAAISATAAAADAAAVAATGFATLPDTAIASISDLEIIQWDAASAKFRNRTFSEANIASAATLSTHRANTNNPHGVTKAQVGLANVDNTSDSNKPVSSAMQTALNAKQASDTTLTGLAEVPFSNNTMVYATGADTFRTTQLTYAARALLNDTNTSYMRRTLQVDVAGTDNSTNVSLAGAYNYLSLAGQVLTLGQVDLATDVTGFIPADSVAEGTVTQHQGALAVSQGQVAGLRTALATKVPSSSYTAADVLAKTITVDGAGSNLDADLLDGTQLATIVSNYQAYADAAVAAAVGAAPAALDTLVELSAALGNDANYAATITAAIATKQESDTTLTALAGTVITANKLVYGNGADSFATTPFTAYARTLLDDRNAAAMRTTLGLGTAAVTASSEYATATQGSRADTVHGWGNHRQRSYLRSNKIGVSVQPYNAATVVGGADNVVDRIILKDTGETVNVLGGLGGGAVNIDLEKGNVVSATIDTSTTTITFINPTATAVASGITLWLTNGGSQITTFVGADYPASTAPVLTTTGLDKLVFETIDGGTTWTGNLAGANYG